jgi:hypothetical protein
MHDAVIKLYAHHSRAIIIFDPRLISSPLSASKKIGISLADFISRRNWRIAYE